MKIFTASSALSILLSVTAAAEDKPPVPTAPTRSAPTPAQGEKQSAQGKPPILTLDAQKPDPSSGFYNAVPLAPGGARLPVTAPDAANPGQPVLPPNLRLTPAIPEGEQSIPLTSGTPAPLAPGIYIASPYTGIVVVPGPIDVPIVRNPGPTPGVMPAPEPQLKLTPKTK